MGTFSDQRNFANSRIEMPNKEILPAIHADAKCEVLTLETIRFADEDFPPQDLDGMHGEEEDD